MDWYLNHRKDLAKDITYMECSEKGHRYLLAIPKRERLERVLKVLFDEEGISFRIWHTWTFQVS